MKQCSRCKKTKPRSKFYRDKTAKDGYQSQCKVCRTKHREEVRQRWPLDIMSAPFPPEGKKICIKCDRLRSVDEFNECPTAKDRLSSRCKDCQ